MRPTTGKCDHGFIGKCISCDNAYGSRDKKQGKHVDDTRAVDQPTQSNAWLLKTMDASDRAYYSRSYARMENHAHGRIAPSFASNYSKLTSMMLGHE